jgi:hypothetical protein
MMRARKRRFNNRDALIISACVLTLIACAIIFIGEITPKKTASPSPNGTEIGILTPSGDNATVSLDTRIVRYDTGGNGSCRLHLPGPTIVLRMDDVRAYSYPAPFLINETLRRNIPIVLGLMPADAELDRTMIGYLHSIRDSPLIEIAQHGSNHTLSDINMSEAELLAGKNKIEDLFGASPITYIPPYNEISDGLRAALARNFKVLSSDWDLSFNSSLIELGQNVETHVFSNRTDSQPQGDVPAWTIVSDCRSALNSTGLCVVTLHPQEFSSKLVGVRDLPAEKFGRYWDILDGLQSLNATFRTFRELIDCS